MYNSALSFARLVVLALPLLLGTFWELKAVANLALSRMQGGPRAPRLPSLKRHSAVCIVLRTFLHVKDHLSTFGPRPTVPSRLALQQLLTWLRHECKASSGWSYFVLCARPCVCSSPHLWKPFVVQKHGATQNIKGVVFYTLTIPPRF